LYLTYFYLLAASSLSISGKPKRPAKLALALRVQNEVQWLALHHCQNPDSIEKNGLLFAQLRPSQRSWYRELLYCLALTCCGGYLLLPYLFRQIKNANGSEP
jgi:hypothetical protein